ncbi:hypothetical protein GTO27_07570 [Candidatus Bathyarchaeota archaeon]|nr:hypothetical protein [Candidatus Bathyarchaeota archaeon]
MLSFTNDSLFITLNGFDLGFSRGWRKTGLKAVSKEDAEKIVVDFVKEKKDAERVDVSMVEQKKEAWIVSGTCPIDLEGHPWTERFEVIVDRKGNVRSSYFSLL